MNAHKILQWLRALLVVSAVALPAAAEQPPNIVFIFADDWGWGDLSCHGHPHLHTPNLDRLAKEGIDFQQFNVCNPVCSPSRTAAMTGHFPARYSVHQHFAEHEQNRSRGMPDWLDPKAVMLPRLLQQAGYRTGHFGKWHLTNITIPDAPRVQEYGFDESAVFNGPPPHANHDTMLDAAVRFIQSNNDGQFYVNVWLHETHTPHYPREELVSNYADLDEQQRIYAAVVEEGDRKVGRILDTLHELKLEDRTIVIFSADNGPEWTGPVEMKQLRDGLGTYYSVGDTGKLRGRKRSLFEGGVRTPFIVRWPGRTPAGTKDDSTVIAAVDLLPTLCAAAGVALPEDFTPDGENLLPAFEGNPVVRSKPIYWEWQGTAIEPDWWPRLAVREGDWKLLFSPDDERAELYNLVQDPRETKDMAEAQPVRVARLTQMALAWQATIPKSPPANCISKLSEAPHQPPKPAQ
jgi:N-acetylgalactosamine-6-sulfatase